MALDVLILNSGSWTLAEELPASPWHVLIYRQHRQAGNELHIWLPRQDARRSGELAFKRYWVDEAVRWCVEIPGIRARGSSPTAVRPTRLRFAAPDGRVLWAEHEGAKGLGDLSDYDLACLLHTARSGSFSGQ